MYVGKKNLSLSFIRTEVEKMVYPSGVDPAINLLIHSSVNRTQSIIDNGSKRIRKNTGYKEKSIMKATEHRSLRSRKDTIRGTNCGGSNILDIEQGQTCFFVSAKTCVFAYVLPSRVNKRLDQQSATLAALSKNLNNISSLDSSLA